MFRSYRICSLALALLVAAAVAGCANSHAADVGAAPPEPASVSPVGHSGLHLVTLTKEGAERIGLETATIRAAAPRSGANATVATAAVLYDEDGVTWVYLQVAPLSFERARIAVVRTAGPVTLLRSGPPVGSVVATVGMAELRGAEDGVPGEQ